MPKSKPRKRKLSQFGRHSKYLAKRTLKKAFYKPKNEPEVAPIPEGVSATDAHILTALGAIRSEVARIHSHKMVRIYDSIFRVIWLSFLKGVAFGLGSLLGATVIFSVIVFILQRFEFVPIIGEWVTLILHEIETLKQLD